MPTKPVPFRAKVFAYFATADVTEASQLLDDAKAILQERRRSGSTPTISTLVTKVPSVKPKTAKGKGLPKVAMAVPTDVAAALNTL